MNWRMRRLKQEVLALAVQYGDVQWDSQEGTWVMIKAFPLPKGMGKTSTPLLILLPPDYPQVPPRHLDFYMDKGLPLAGSGHYWEEGHPMSSQGWAQFCLEIDNWKSSSDIWSGDHLLKLAETISTALTALARRR